MALILLVCLFLFPPIVLQVLQDYDNSVYGIVVRNMLDGGELYRDIFDHKLPGWYRLVGGFVRLLGDSPVSLNLMYLTFLIAGAWAIYGIAVRAGSRVWIAAAWACLFALWPDKLDNHLQYFGSMSVHFTNAGAVIASMEALSLFAVLGRRVTCHAAAGALMACACLIKPQSALLALLLPLWSISAVSGQDRRERLRQTAAYAAAFVIPSLAVLAWMRLGGMWPYFVEAMRYNKAYVAATPLRPGLAFLSGAIREGPDILLVSAGAALVIWMVRRRSGTLDSRLTLVCLWFLCGLIETVAGKRYFIHTRIVLFAPAAVLSALVWTALESAAERYTGEKRRRHVAAALAALLLITAVTRLDVRFQRTLSLWAHSLRGQSYLSEAPIGSHSSAKILAGRWLWDHTEAGDAVEVVGPAAPPVLYEAGRPPAGRAPGTRFTFPFPLEGIYGGSSVTQPRSMTERFWMQWLADMRRSRPAYLMDSWEILDEAITEGSDPVIPAEALSFLRDSYRRVTRLYGLDVFELINPLRAPAPANPWELAVQGPVLTAAQGGGRDFFVIEDGTEFRAWYSSQDRKAILQARSPDGLRWMPRRMPALTAQRGEIGVNQPCVVRSRRGFRMWFTAETEYGSAIKSAVSADGRLWRRVANRGIGFRHLPQTRAPSVMFDEGANVYRMWCFAGSRGYGRYVLLESRDGVNWQDAATDGQHGLLREPICIVRDSGWYFAFYSGEATGSGPNEVSLARSRKPEGPWEEYPWNPILTPEPETWMDGEVSAPCVVRQSDGWLLYFTGRGYRDASYQIGLARCSARQFWP